MLEQLESICLSKCKVLHLCQPWLVTKPHNCSVVLNWEPQKPARSVKTYEETQEHVRRRENQCWNEWKAQIIVKMHCFPLVSASAFTLLYICLVLFIIKTINKTYKNTKTSNGPMWPFGRQRFPLFLKYVISVYCLYYENIRKTCGLVTTNAKTIWEHKCLSKCLAFHWVQNWVLRNH